MKTDHKGSIETTSDHASRLGERLIALREQCGLSLSELAERTGISRSSLYKVENSGAKGVLEGLRHFGWLELVKETA